MDSARIRRNPVLGLPAAQEILSLSIEIRRPLGLLLRQLAAQARDKANKSWASHKPPMAAYWAAVAVWAKHIARVVDPAEARQ